MGITSIGKGNLPSTSTSFEPSHTQINFLLAAATIFNSNICTFQRGQVDVELSSPRLLGHTAWKAGDASSPHEVAMEVKPTLFFEEYFSVFE